MTTKMRFYSGWTAALAIAAGLPWGLGVVSGRAQSQTPAAPQIPSLSEPGEGLTIRHREPRSGLVTFASSDGRGILVSVQANAPTETRARSFAGQYGGAFGITEQTQLRLARQPDIDALGVEHARFQQQHNGIPVTGSAFFVHLRGSRVMAANAKTLPIEQMPETTAHLTADQAVAAARQYITHRRAEHAGGARYSAPRLEILNRGMLEDGRFPSHLTWFIEVSNAHLREFMWVDARTGGIALKFNQLTDAKNRAIYDSAGTGALPGLQKRLEGQAATGDVEEDGLYNLLGAAYDHFSTQHGRDSYDGAGAQIVGSVDWFVVNQCPNAFWNGIQTAYCDGMVAEDIVAHEFTHAVTEHTANLFYFTQSGALNESFSDIFGETIDQLDGIGTDTVGVKWQIGEGVVAANGPIRNMMTPTIHGDPGKMSDTPQFVCDPNNDGGGVHINSGVPNHAYALMVDGGTFNGHTITGIGLTKAAKIQYRALSVYLSSGSNFLDNYNAVNQSCSDLIGTSGITASDCTQVTEAMRAVEMNQKPTCTTYVTPPPLCANGANPTSPTYTETFEVFPPVNWGISFTTDDPNFKWGIGNFWGKGELHAFGPNAPQTSDHSMFMTANAAVPAGGRLYFEHAFDFDAEQGFFFDGGIVQYSTDNGANWITVPQVMIEAGRTYPGTLEGSGNPLGAVAAFAGDSFGFTGTRIDLSSLAGQNIRLRFRIGTDGLFAFTGWSVDNVRIYSCPDGATTDMVRNGSFTVGGAPPPNWLTFSTGTPMVFNTAGGVFNYQRPGGNTQGVVFQNTGIAVPAFGALQASWTMANTDPARKRFSVLIHDGDFSDLSVCTFWLDGSAPTRTYTMRTHTTKAWTNATISIYAASVGSGGFYQLDNVTMAIQPAQSSEVTECVDPVVPVAGGSTSGEMIVNGTFTGGVGPWTPFGQISWQLSGANVFEFFKLAGSPSGVLLQQNLGAVANDQRLGAQFQLGNSSNIRQRVTVIIHDNDFSDLHACTFFLPPGLPLSNFGMRTYATEAWTNATFSVYPATVGTAPANQWLRLDNVTMVRTLQATTGTQCFEPGDVPVNLFSGGKR